MEPHKEGQPSVSEDDASLARRKRRLPPFVPVRLLLCAAALAGAYLICHALGMRENVSVLPIIAGGGSPGTGAAVLALLYVALYLGFVIVVPILLIASVIFAALAVLFGRGRPASKPGKM